MVPTRSSASGKGPQIRAEASGKNSLETRAVSVAAQLIACRSGRLEAFR